MNEQINQAIKEAASEVFPTNLLSLKKGVLGDDMFARICIAANPSQFINGISQNDPLSLLMCISEDTVEFVNKSISINPENKYYAYGSHKFSLRKFKFKDANDLKKKLIKNLTKVKDDGRELVAKDVFTVYDSYPEIKQRIIETFS